MFKGGNIPSSASTISYSINSIVHDHLFNCVEFLWGDDILMVVISDSVCLHSLFDVIRDALPQRAVSNGIGKAHVSIDIVISDIIHGVGSSCPQKEDFVPLTGGPDREVSTISVGSDGQIKQVGSGSGDRGVCSVVSRGILNVKIGSTAWEEKSVDSVEEIGKILFGGIVRDWDDSATCRLYEFDVGAREIGPLIGIENIFDI